MNMQCFAKEVRIWEPCISGYISCECFIPVVTVFLHEGLNSRKVRPTTVDREKNGLEAKISVTFRILWSRCELVPGEVS